MEVPPEHAAQPAEAVLAKRPFDRTRDELQQLASYLAQHCTPFFSGMPLTVLQHLCSCAGHVVLEEGQPAYTQGQVGDCMYIVVRGSVCVLQHPLVHAAAAGTGLGGGGSDSSSKRSSITGAAAAHADLPTAGRRVTGQQCQCDGPGVSIGGTPVASRRATMELQAQQFALASATVGTAGAAGGAPRQPGSTAGSRRVTALTAEVPAGGGSRRATMEQLARQQLAESTPLGVLGPGESFGEAALVNAKQGRTVSVAAGPGGALLLLLDRACFARLQRQAQEGQPLAAVAVQAVLAAACRPLLRGCSSNSSSGRLPHDVETLAELFGGLKAFEGFPWDVRTRLARCCQGVALPAGVVVFEEDDRGDAMFVVVSGTLQVRARPLQHQLQAGAEEQPPAAQHGGIMALALTTMRATTDGVAAPAAASASGSAAACRRTTWEGAAFTEAEQDRLRSVRAAVAAEQRDGQRQAHAAPQDSQQASGLHWTARFMSAAAASAAAAGPQWGLEGGMTPLQAVFKAEWRQQARERALALSAQTTVSEGAAAQDRAYAAMEEMLGKAAAKAWRQARDTAAGVPPAGHAPAPPDGGSTAAPPTQAAAAQAVDDATACEPVDVKLGTSGGADTPTSEPSAEGDLAAAAAVAAAGEAGGRSTADGEGAAAGTAVGPCSPRTAAAAAAQLLAAAAATPDPVRATKLHLAALGVNDPADVSRTLLSELGARASLDGLLQAVAGYVGQQGLQRLTKKSSVKVTNELNRRMLAGASWQGYNGAGGGGSRASGHRDVDSGIQGVRGDHTPELSTGGTCGESSCDWRSRSGGESEAMTRSTSFTLGAAGSGGLDDDGAAGQCVTHTADAAADGDDGTASASARVLPDAGGTPAAAARGANTPGWGSEGELAARYGPVVRMLCTGESFGELALLQRSATRTATVVVAPATGTDGSGAQGDAAAGAASSGALLIKVSRAAYDSVVRALHVAALEELLGFLGSLPPFAGLPRELLTSLAVFARPLAAQPGQRVAAAGAAADALIVLQEGELRLLDGCAPGAAAGSTSVHHHGAPDGRPRARGATAEAAAVLAKHGSASSSGLDAALGRSASSGVSQGGGVQLAILGPGSLLGENVLGYDPEEVLDPAEAIAAAPHRKARQAALAAAAALTHHATAVAASPCKLLVLSAGDLRRFGRRVRAPLAAAAAARRDWVHARREAVRGTQAGLSPAAAGMLPSLSKAPPSQHQPLASLGFGHGAAVPSIHSRAKSNAGVAPGRVPGTASEHASAGGVLQAAGAAVGMLSAAGRRSTRERDWPGLAGLLAPAGSSAAIVAAVMRRADAGVSAAAATRNEWQQRQWHEAAYGGLSDPQQQQQQQQPWAAVAPQLRKVVPAMQPPSVSELAAAVRTFPAGMLTAAASDPGALASAQWE